MDVEDFRTQPGDYLPKVVERVVARANERGTPVRLEFNGIVLVVAPGRTAEDVVEEWERERSASVTAYRESPAGKRADAEAAAGLAQVQSEHDRLTAIPIATLSESDLIGWLEQYADAVDYIGVWGRDYGAVADALEAAAYKQNDAMGLPISEYNNPRVMARYIVGQAIDCLRKGLPPHPVIHNFASKYREATGAARSDHDRLH